MKHPRTINLRVSSLFSILLSVTVIIFSLTGYNYHNGLDRGREEAAEQLVFRNLSSSIGIYDCLTESPESSGKRAIPLPSLEKTRAYDFYKVKLPGSGETETAKKLVAVKADLRAFISTQVATYELYRLQYPDFGNDHKDLSDLLNEAHKITSAQQLDL